jgi:hypothetical protein
MWPGKWDNLLQAASFLNPGSNGGATPEVKENIGHHINARNMADISMRLQLASPR